MERPLMIVVQDSFNMRLRAQQLNINESWGTFNNLNLFPNPTSIWNYLFAAKVEINSVKSNPKVVAW